MANPGRGEVALVVAGARITLRFTIGALASLQDAWGYPYSPEGFQAFSSRLQALAREDMASVVSHGGRSSMASLRDVSAAAALLGQGREDEIRSVVARAISLALTPPASTDEPPQKNEPFSWESLLDVALKSGMSPREVWDETPRSVTQFITAARWRRDREWEMVWLNAAWSRMGAKMPALSSIVGKSAPAGAKLSGDDAVALIAAVWGTPLVDPAKAAN